MGLKASLSGLTAAIVLAVTPTLTIPDGFSAITPAGIPGHAVWLGDSDTGQEPQVSLMERNASIEDVIRTLTNGNSNSEVSIRETNVPGSDRAVTVSYPRIDGSLVLGAVIAQKGDMSWAVTASGSQEEWDRYGLSEALSTFSLS